MDDAKSFCLFSCDALVADPWGCLLGIGDILEFELVQGYEPLYEFAGVWRGACPKCEGDISQQKAQRCLLDNAIGVLVESGFTGLGKHKLIPFCWVRGSSYHWDVLQKSSECRLIILVRCSGEVGAKRGEIFKSQANFTVAWWRLWKRNVFSDQKNPHNEILEESVLAGTRFLLT